MIRARDVLRLLARVAVLRVLHKLGLCPCQPDDDARWVEYVEGTRCELVPIDDLVAHERGDDCACLPAVTLDPQSGDGDQWLVTHHAWDGRE